MSEFLKWMMVLSAGHVLDYDGARSTGGNRQNLTAAVRVSMGVANAVRTTAQNVPSYASRLAATQTFTAINGTTATDNGALGVIDVAGAPQTNQAMTPSGGGRVSHVLFSLTDPVGHAPQSAGSHAFVGTFSSRKRETIHYCEPQSSWRVDQYGRQGIE